MPTQGSAPPEAAIYQSFTPHRAGLPNLVEYFSELWRRRQFAQEMSKAAIRGSGDRTALGTLWLVLDPALQAAVYFILISFVRAHSANGPGPGETIARLTSALFAFRMCTGCVSAGARSVTGAGKMLLNTNFPRLLIPLSAVRTGFYRFLPAIPLYLLIHLLTGQPWRINMLAGAYFLACILVFGMGMSALTATLTVYFRDFARFLPYILRMWMYLSPVLWSPPSITSMPTAVQTIVQFNPMYSMLGGYSDLLLTAQWPPLYMWITSVAFAAGAVIVGFLFFISREREFAVRIL